MIEEVKIYNRFNMDMFALTGGLNFPYINRNWSLVSIHTTPEEIFLTDKNIKTLQELGMKEYISLCFWDITKSDGLAKAFPDAIFFSEEQGKDLIGMITMADQWDNGVLVAHCDAGISRSGAVGQFAIEHLGLDNNAFIKDNPYLNPNPLVLSILRKLSGSQYESAFGKVEE